MEISKISSALETRASKEHVDKFGSRLETFLQEIKVQII
jgi:hypothetical protein